MNNTASCASAQVFSANSISFPEPPQGWLLNEAGVFALRPSKKGEVIQERVCGPIWVEAITRSVSGDEGDGGDLWGYWLVFFNRGGLRRQIAVRGDKLIDDRSELARELALLGLAISPGRVKALYEYLAAWEDVKKLVLSSSRLGWVEHEGRLAFVLPDRTITASGEPHIVYQPESFSPTAQTVRASGSLEDWGREVGSRIAGNDYLLFAACVGFAPPLLHLAELDSCIFHLWGLTSRGKTTLAQVAASVWGCGVDPAESSRAYIRRWNATGNGMEGLAEAYSDILLVMDELGSSGDHRDFASLIYQLAGGQGKTAMNSNRTLKRPRSWRTICLSTGEIDIKGKLAAEGRPMKGGLQHRAVDIEVSDIAAHVPEAQRMHFVDALKRACANHYGVAGPALLRAILDDFPSYHEASRFIREALDKVVGHLIKPNHAPEVQRTLRRFALVGLAGELASRYGVLPVPAERVWDAVKAMAVQWLGDSGDTDADRIVDSVRMFLMRNSARFQVADFKVFDIPHRAGFRSDKRELYLFTRDALMEAAPGYDARVIARALKDAGFLFTNDSKLMAVMSTPLGRGRWYAVKFGIMEDQEKERQSVSEPREPRRPDKPAAKPAVGAAKPIPGPIETPKGKYQLVPDAMGRPSYQPVRAPSEPPSEPEVLASSADESWREELWREYSALRDDDGWGWGYSGASVLDDPVVIED
ncbi:MAG: DUF927 domain-containing protein [Halothiobacillaceae bacterium]